MVVSVKAGVQSNWIGDAMEILTRNTGESLVIGGNIKITVSNVKASKYI